MKLALQLIAVGLTALFLASCGTSSIANNNPGRHPSGTGPFDSRGNYVEDWADSPSKWRKNSGPSTKPGDALNIAANDEPPADSVPIPTAANTRQVADIGSAPVIVSRPKPTASTTNSSATTARRTTTSSASNTPPARRTTSSATAAKPKPKSTATASKTKAKPKAATARYTIKKGDSLSAIASRNNTSVAALQRANGIKGSLIQPGKSLVIPKN